MTVWYRIIRIGELYGREKKREDKPPPGPVTYYVPEMVEYTIFPPRDILRLRAYLRSANSPAEVLRKAGERGFPLYFQGHRKGFTNGKLYGIMLPDCRHSNSEDAMIYCKQYNQRVDPALCLARSIMYPKQLKPSPEYEIVREKYEKAKGKKEKRKLRRELRRLDPILDPYPYCRRCPVVKKLQKSCLGAQFDPEDEECQNCKDKIKCCQLMRLRIESVLAGSREEVVKEILKDWQKLRKKRKEEKQMAKKKKIEEVTEEVVEEIQEQEEEEKKKSKKKKKNETKKEKAKNGKKSKSERAKDKEIKTLLKELEEAKEEGDQIKARMIRKKLREEYGYYLSKNRE